MLHPLEYLFLSQYETLKKLEQEAWKSCSPHKDLVSNGRKTVNASNANHKIDF